MSLFGLGAIFILVSSYFLGMILIFKHLWVTKSRIRSCLINLSILASTLIYSLLIIEFFLYFFVTPSDAFNISLASKRWFAKYWKPINSLGYRDIEHNVSRLVGKKVIFVVGDSFVAGQGIKNYKNRFSNILQDILGKDWVIITIAECGWDTLDEYNGIVSYPYKPKIIILSYFINDIEGAAYREGFNMPVIVERPPKIIAPFLNRSYLFNFIYWRLYMESHDRNTISNVYLEYLQQCYSREEIWQRHKSELLGIINYAGDQNIELVVIIFPSLTEIESSKPIISKVINFMNHHEVRVINMADKLAGRNRQELIVSPRDPHPSERLHREVAELLAEYIYEVDNKNTDK